MSAPTLTIIGNHISPFVRKVLAVCEVKGLAYEIDSIVPFFGGDRFAQLSPLRRIPVLLDGDLVLNDSSVICEYLDEKWPDVPVLPRDPAARAQARYLDEYADTRMADVLLWKVFGRALIGPAIFRAHRDVEAIQKTMAEEVPAVLDHLEAWAPAEGYTMGARPGLADFSVAAHFLNFRAARGQLDVARWPKTHAWITRVEEAAPMRRLNEIGAKILRVQPDAHRETLQSMGVPVSAVTVGGTAPRRGPMTVI